MLQCEGVHTGSANNLGMSPHARIMHYALPQGKCLLHHSFDYLECMDTANDRLREIRSRKYGTAVAAAEAIGIKPATYIQHENGTRGSGSIPRKAAERYADFFRVSLDWLLTGRGDGPPPSTEPSEAELQEMLKDAFAEVLTTETKISDLPRIVAPNLHEQLERFRADRAVASMYDEVRARDTTARSRPATKPSAQGESRNS